jgi:hypothetical protein
LGDPAVGHFRPVSFLALPFPCLLFFLDARITIKTLSRPGGIRLRVW